MNKTATERGWGELAFVGLTKIAWLGISMGMMVVIYKMMLGMFFNTFGFTSNLWVVVTGLVIFGLGLIINKLYDTAFD